MKAYRSERADRRRTGPDRNWGAHAGEAALGELKGILADTESQGIYSFGPGFSAERDMDRALAESLAAVLPILDELAAEAWSAEIGAAVWDGTDRAAELAYMEGRNVLAAFAESE
jgi:hypothetical protein